MSATPVPSPGSNPFVEGRGNARLAAVQALYQMDIGGRGSSAVIREFREHRFVAPSGAADDAADEPAPETVDADRGADAEVDAEDSETARLYPVDDAFFAAIIDGVVANQASVDDAVRSVLASGWKLERLDATVRAILRAGAFEVLHRPDVPPAASIDAYVTLARAFFEAPEPAFINAALDALSRQGADAQS